MDDRRRRILQALGVTRWVSRGSVEPEAEREEPPPLVGKSAAREQEASPEEGRGGQSVAIPPAAASSSLELHTDQQTTGSGDETPEASSSPGDGDVSQLDWEALAQRVASCQACELAKSRTQTVFGVGVRDARAMIIGEAPGADEDRQGEPFVGRAGKLLDAMLAAIELSRQKNCYIANILKCRPPNNRDPRPEEVAACFPYLARQIELIAPRAILAVGRIAAQNLLQVTTPIGKLRGRVHHYGPNDIPVVVTYHPAYLLRSPLEKRKAWEDLKLYRRLLKGA